jgi:hypothetical protein
MMLSMSLCLREIKMDKQELIKTLNNLRKNDKNWVWYDVTLDDGRNIEYKAIDTWVQFLKIDGIKYSSVMGLSVKGFNNFLNECLL